ncbi:DUF512 domain-containing protein [bacterium]|nr:DUF512 domain-containing protein [bacterium]
MSKETGLNIESVAEGSAAEAAGLQRGDRLLSVNGHALGDMIDFHFYAGDKRLKCRFIRDGREKKAVLKQREGVPLGLHFEPLRYAVCGNNCLFCFIDQNPRGLRETIYIKDEDYRMSFLYGNYVTLTRTGPGDVERIIEQRLSPLYVSVHAVDPDVRRRLLGLKKDDGLLEKLRRLCDAGIEVHAQIVLCPGVNDGDVLAESIDVLERFYPALRSLAVVPVGLTAHRDGLPDLRPVDAAAAADVLHMGGRFQGAFAGKHGEPFVYFADEFYLLAGRELPPDEHYGHYWQTGNGVGITREFLVRFELESRDFPASLPAARRLTLVTGTLAAPVLRDQVLPVLNRIGNLTAGVHAVENRLFGSSVTVSGLLCGRDIVRSLQHVPEDGAVLLPPNCLNTDGVLLDDMTPAAMAEKLGREVVVVEDFAELWDGA